MPKLSKTENKPGSACANCHSIRNKSYGRSQSEPVYFAVNTCEKPEQKSSCHAKDSWPPYLNKPHANIQNDSYWAKRNYLDTLTQDQNSNIPIFSNINFKACLKFKKNNKWLGPWYAKLFAGIEVRTDEGARICFNLTGNENGVIIDGNTNPPVTFQGITFDSWSETARPNYLDFINNQPILKTAYRKSWYSFWYKKEMLAMNPVVNFGDKIPIYYRILNKRRLSNSEYTSIYGPGKIGQVYVKKIPLLYDIVESGKLPHIISPNIIRDFTTTWSQTWHKKKVPEGVKDKIAEELATFFLENAIGIEGDIEAQPKSICLPGFYAKFKTSEQSYTQQIYREDRICKARDNHKTKIKFSTSGLGQMPYSFTLNSNVELEQLYFHGLLDMGKATARIKSYIELDKDKSEYELYIKDINAHLNPFRYGSPDPETSPLLETFGGRIRSGNPNSKIPAGISIVKDKQGKVKTTLNLNTEHKIKTPLGSFKISGNVLARLEGNWQRGMTPQVSVGKNYIEINDLEIYQDNSQKLLISNARLIVTDDPDEKRTFLAAHPEFKTENPGFIVRLEFKNAKNKGYVLGFIPSPLDHSKKYYNPQRFSVQHTLNFAIALATNELGSKVEGQIKISKLNELEISNNSLRGKGIKVSGEFISISGHQARYLLKKGLLKFVSRISRDSQDPKNRQWYAIISADRVALRNKNIDNPYVAVRFSTSHGNEKININVEELLAEFKNIAIGKSHMGNGTLSGKLKLGYEHRRRLLTIHHLTNHLRVNRIASANLGHLSRGKISSFDIDGYIKGHWEQDLKNQRGHGWLGIIGDREGDLHLRDEDGRRIGDKKLGYEIPLFSDTRWIALRIDGVDSRGWINGQFCLRTDIDPLALRSLGVKHSDYFEWRMSHDNIAFPSGIVARSQNYYNKLIKGKLLSAKPDKEADPCTAVFNKIR